MSDRNVLPEKITVGQVTLAKGTALYAVLLDDRWLKRPLDVINNSDLKNVLGKVETNYGKADNNNRFDIDRNLDKSSLETSLKNEIYDGIFKKYLNLRGEKEPDWRLLLAMKYFPLAKVSKEALRKLCNLLLESDITIDTVAQFLSDPAMHLLPKKYGSHKLIVDALKKEASTLIAQIPGVYLKQELIAAKPQDRVKVHDAKNSFVSILKWTMSPTKTLNQLQKCLLQEETNRLPAGKHIITENV